MKKIAVVTDSNSGITQEQAQELGVYVLPMPFTIDGKEYFEGINLTQRDFYEYLKKGAEIATSQPSPQSVLELWDNLLTEYEEIIHIPMSSGLSGSCATAHALAADYDGRVHVINNQRISVTQRQSALDAVSMAEQGYSADAIETKLMEEALQSSIYIMVDTLKYLKKGGRITPAAAALGEILRLKPVLQIQGEKLDAFAKARNLSNAKGLMLNALQKDLEERFGGVCGMDEPKNMHLCIAHTENETEAFVLKQEMQQRFPGYDIHIDPLSLSVSCHIGPGALAVACSRVVAP